MNTIIAVATPPGRGAVGMVRISGPESLAITRSLLEEPDFSPPPAQVILKNVIDPDDHKILDRVLITYFKAPHSFTGEDVIEISCHGSPVILRRLIDLTLRLDARLAGPGEFTLRALSNRKLDLNQAEAIRDLINAQTYTSARQAMRQLSGELSARLGPIKEQLLQLVVSLESSLEFVEDDLPELRAEETKRQATEILDQLNRLATTFSVGQLLREGLKVTIAGRPNVGKSSLFNSLLKFDRAIVTEMAGTTRDSLTEAISINGVPVILTDTAGLREASDQIESIGVERTRRSIAEADLLLIVIDGSVDLSSDDVEALSYANERRHVVVTNKSDLGPFKEQSALAGHVHRPISVSALTGEGIEELSAAILEPFGSIDSEDGGLLVTDSRHYDLLCRAQKEIEASRGLMQENASEEFILVGLHNALRFLGELTGEIMPEDILSRIFSTFCIGK